MTRVLVIVAAMLPLAGCLEVQQYPAYRQGQFNGKPDNLHATANFHGDRLAWNAAIVDRNQLQNEYNRTEPPPARRQEARR